VRRFLLLTILAAACVLASAASATTDISAPPVNFTDPIGDNGTAPDIASIGVTNDDHGLYTFTIGLGAPYPDAGLVDLIFDTDQNTATGDPNFGAEFLFGDDHSAHQFEIDTWSASANDFVQAADTTASVTISSDLKTITFSVNKSELGNVDKFNFIVLTADSSSTANNAFDVAPSGTAWFTYQRQTVFTLTTTGSHNGAAKAGRTWSVGLTATRSDTNAPVGSEASISCQGTSNGKKLAVAGSTFDSSGAAVCTFKVPKTPKKQVLKATVTITDSGQTASQSFSARTH
jgi:hypothetical protein